MVVIIKHLLLMVGVTLVEQDQNLKVVQQVVVVLVKVVLVVVQMQVVVVMV